MLATIYAKTLRERTTSMLIGSVSVALMTLLAIWVYSDLDDVIVEFATSLPEAFVSALRILPEDGGTGIVLGEMMNLIAPMVLGGLAISIGTSAIAGEERDGTIGVLLANPKSRSAVLISKTRAMLTVVTVGSILIWLGTSAAVSLTGSQIDLAVGAMMVHVFAISMFFGLLALLLGSWTGNTMLASGLPVGLMILSFLAAGLLPLVEGFENGAKIFPWYYFNSSQPLQNGVDTGHLALLLEWGVAFFGLSVLGVNRRDLRAGAQEGQFLERILDGRPRLAAYAAKISGKVQVANIVAKTATEHQAVAVIASAAIFYTAIIVGPFYNSLSGAIGGLIGAMPEGLLALVGSVDMSTPAGWYYGELFSLIVPAAIITVVVSMGVEALAGEEHARTMDTLLVNPIKRSKIVVDKALAMVGITLLIALATFLGTAAGALIGGLDLSMSNIAAASTQAFGLGVFFGAVAIFGGAASGHTKIAAYGATGVALLGYVTNSFFSVSERLAEWARVSPFYYYTENQPLANGMSWGNLGILFLAGIVLVGMAVFLFERRDMRN